MGALAEFERHAIAARQQGHGRRKEARQAHRRSASFEERQLETAQRRIAAGATNAAVARLLGVDPWTLSCSLERERKP